MSNATPSRRAWGILGWYRSTSFVPKKLTATPRLQFSRDVPQSAVCGRREIGPTGSACRGDVPFNLFTSILLLPCLVMGPPKLEAEAGGQENWREHAPVQGLLQAVVRDPNKALAYNALATAQNQAGKPQDACLSGPGGKDSQPADWDSLAPVLEPLYRCVERSDSSCANKALAQIHGPIRNTPDYLVLEARAFALERRKDEAFAAINRAVEKGPGEYRYLMTQGQIYQSFNDQASAIRSFLLADQARPDSTETFYFLGMSFFFLEEYPRAEKHFLEAIKLDPKNHRATFMLGVSKMITFKLSEAKGYFEQALKLQPDNPFYHLHYGILLGRMGDKGPAIEQVRIAERLDPSYALTHYNLGHLYKELGDYQAAKEQLEIAIRSRPGLAEAYYQLGTVYHHLGMEEDSRKAYQEFQKVMTEEKRNVLDPVESNVLRHEP